MSEDKPMVDIDMGSTNQWPAAETSQSEGKFGLVLLERGISVLNTKQVVYFLL
jgi:hypothetical protein